MGRGSTKLTRRGRTRTLARRVGGFYLEVLGTYRKSWLRILLLALIVFIPVSLIELGADGLFDSLDPDRGIEAVAILTTSAMAISTNLLGEVFFAGVIAISLADARAGKFPSLRHIAGRIRYLRLILLDLLFVLVTVTGFVLVIVPGILAFTFFGLAGPVVEIEHRRILNAFRRSFSLVRTDFWLVFWVLIPVSTVGNALSSGTERLITSLTGHGKVATELATAVSESVFSPLFAIAAVLLTLQLIERRDAALGGRRGCVGCSHG